MKDVTILISTFMRPDRVKECLDSVIESNLKFKKVIVADNGKITKETEKMYREYKNKLPMELIKLPFDVGISASRNAAIKKTKTKYALMLDDDMQIPKNVFLLKEILEKNKKLGGVSGILKEKEGLVAGAYNFYFSDALLVMRSDENKEYVRTSKGKIPIYYFDLVTNACLFRTSCLKEGNWDENYIIELEHSDFFLNHKKNTNWKFALTKKVKFQHNPGGEKKFIAHRWSFKKREKSLKHFKNKWNIKQIVRVSVFVDRDETTMFGKLKIKIRENIPIRILAVIQRIFALRRHIII